MLQKCSGFFFIWKQAIVSMPGHLWRVFIFFFHDLYHGQVLTPSVFPHTFPSFPYLMSKNLFKSTDVSSSGYVNIYWHDSQQQQEGEVSTSYHSGKLQVLSESVQSMRTGKVCSLYLTWWVFALLVPVCCRCHSYSCGRLYQLLQRLSPAHTTRGWSCSGEKWSL